eukprot:2447102-Pyramimonas_sp.AAC.1
MLTRLHVGRSYRINGEFTRISSLDMGIVNWGMFSQLPTSVDGVLHLRVHLPGPLRAIRSRPGRGHGAPPDWAITASAAAGGGQGGKKRKLAEQAKSKGGD